MKEKDVSQEKWSRWISEKSKCSREELLLDLAPWAKSLSRSIYFKYPNPIFEQEDYFHWAVEGLIQSLDRFSGNSDDFKKYAYKRVHGAVIDGLCSQGSSGRSDTQELISYLFSESEHNLEGPDDWAGLLSEVALIKLLESGAAIADVVDVSPYKYCESISESKIIKVLVESLECQLRDVIFGYYFEGKSLTLISEKIGVSRSRICQIHKQAIHQMKLKYVQIYKEESYYD